MKTVTGNGIVTVGDAAPYKKELTVYGNTRQNLWTNPATRTENGVTLTNNADGTITLDGTCTANIWISIIVYNIKANTTYTVSLDKAVQNSGDGIAAFYIEEWYADGASYSHAIQPNNTSLTFTTKSSVSNARCAFLAYTGAVLSGTYRVMLREATEEEIAAAQQTASTLQEGGTADLTQEQLENTPMLLPELYADEPFDWCPPGIHGVEDLTVVTAGKNLTGASEFEAYWALQTAGVRDDMLAALNLLGAGTYTISADFELSSKTASFDGATDSYGFAFGVEQGDYVMLDNNRKWGAGAQVGDVKHYEATFEVDSDEAGRIGVFYSYGAGRTGYGQTGTASVTNVQIERGTQATAYEPPNITQTPIDLQGHQLHSLTEGTRDALHVDSSGACSIGQAVGYVASYGSQPIGSDFIASAYTADGQPAQGATVIWPLEERQTVDLGSIEMPYMLRGVNNVMAVSDVTPEIELSYYPLAPCSDGIIANDRHSFHDLGQCIASRNTGAPEKKAITKTVPFMSGFYDFSNMYGGIAYESREISYSFELLGDSREDLQRQKSELMEWLSYVHDTEIRDDDIPGWHFIGSFSGYSWDETADGESGTLEATFLCQPFMEADEETSKALAIGTHTVTNDGQPVNPVVSVASGTAKITINGFVQSVTGETRLSVQLPNGDTSVKVEGAAATLKWKEARI